MTGHDVGAPLPVGSRIDQKWEVEHLLGSGSTAHVYAAKHIYGFDAALKVMHAHLATTPERVKQFLAQGYLSNQVNHPAIVQVYNDGESEHGPYLVMDRVRGETLEARLSRVGRLPTPVALRLARQLLEVVVTIHHGGLAHRRLNPTELLVDRDDALHVIDFDAGRGEDTFLRKHLSLVPPAMRSPTYFPPELAAAVGVDRAADMWAAGAIMYRMLAGRPPFAATKLRPFAVATERVGPDLAEVRPDLPKALAAAIERALLPDPAMRFSSAEALLAAITRAAT